MGGKVRGIDHVQLAAPPGCEDKARRFFGEILGMRELDKPEELRGRGGVWFECGDKDGAAGGAQGGQQLHIGVEEPFSPARKAHPAFSVQDLASLRARFVHYGVDVLDDGALPGVRRFYVDDPFGNRLEFLEHEE